MRTPLAIAAFLATAGLVLAGCGSSPSASPSSASSTPAASSSATASPTQNSGASASVPFPVAVGNTWVYKTSLGASETGTVTNKITAVVPVSGGQHDGHQRHTGQQDQAGQHLRETAHITVQGAGSATVTVPAGSYHATIVDMTMAVTFEGFPVTIEVRTWLANGVGPVKSEATTDESGASHIASVQELTSFTSG
jgi:hypothetical protein